MSSVIHIVPNTDDDDDDDDNNNNNNNNNNFIIIVIIISISFLLSSVLCVNGPYFWSLIIAGVTVTMLRFVQSSYWPCIPGRNKKPSACWRCPHCLWCSHNLLCDKNHGPSLGSKMATSWPHTSV